MSKAGFPLGGSLPPPLVIRPGRLVVTYRSRWRTLLATVVIISAAIVVGVVVDPVAVVPIVSALVALFWTITTVNAVRGVPMPNLGGRGGGPAPPGSGTHEPRRPRPLSPAGAAALSLPEGDELPSR